MPDEYDFEKQLNIGENGEDALDGYYERYYNIQKVSSQAQRWGIDRVWEHKKKGFKFSVEYKTDDKTPKTGKVFIETVSVDTQDKAGWAYTSCAQLLIYYIPKFGKAYHMGVMTLKYLVDVWKDIYEVKSSPNNGYNTYGICVPLAEFARYCYRVIDITNGDDNDPTV